LGKNLKIQFQKLTLILLMVIHENYDTIHNTMIN
jgi:hypothetical protein